MSSKRVGGFTLIEIMIVVAIVALLAAIALPAYSRYGFRARRVDGQDLVMRVAAAQERFFTTNNAYATTVTAGGLNFVDDLSTHHGPDSYYQISMVTGPGTYTLTATPQAGQANDACGNLTLDNFGQKKFSGNETNGHCW